MLLQQLMTLKDDTADILLHKYKYRPIVQLLKFEKRFPEGYIFETEKKRHGSVLNISG